MKTISTQKKVIISIPGAGWFILCGDQSSRCYPTMAAARAARNRGAKLKVGRH